MLKKCFTHFKQPTTETQFPGVFAGELLSALNLNFGSRFSDFDDIANKIKIFQNIFDTGIETLKQKT